MIAFGPIPSRRLGYSLGINNIPPKSCSYDCLYCQVGPTDNPDIKRRLFYDPEVVFQAVKKRIKEVVSGQGKIDYLTFVPDGEPTLDINLDKVVSKLRTLEYKIAVITNGSLLSDIHVRNALDRVDLVSVKVDSVEFKTWQKINRPDPKVQLRKMSRAIEEFSKSYKGKLITETMLLKGINDDEAGLVNTAKYLAKLNPHRAYLAVPTRPTSENWVKSPDEQVLNTAYYIFSKYLNDVELLTGFSEESFESAGDPIKELLNITAVHPMRESEVIDLLHKGGIGLSQLDELIKHKEIVSTEHQGQTFYIRKLKSNQSQQ